MAPLHRPDTDDAAPVIDVLMMAFHDDEDETDEWLSRYPRPQPQGRRHVHHGRQSWRRVR